MKQEKSMFWLAIIMFASGDIFYLGSLIFRSFMIKFMMYFSPDLSASDLSSTGETTLLFLTSLLGTIMYLVGFLFWAISRPTVKEQKQYAGYGVVTWFITDSLSSILFGFIYNVAFNLVFLTVFLIFFYRIQDDELN